MFLIQRNLGLAARLVMWAGAALVPATGALASGDGVAVSFSFGGPQVPPIPPIVQCVREVNYAGTLTIDGRCFVINTACAERQQILDAFRGMGYDAWLVGGHSIRIRKNCDGPEVCWRNGDFGIAFRERATTITLSLDECAHDTYGSTYRYCFDHVHQRYRSYQQVHGFGGRTEWNSIGFSIFIDADHDHHGNGHHRTNDGDFGHRDGGDRHDGDHRIDRDRHDDGRGRADAAPPRIDGQAPGRTPDTRRRTDDRSSQPGFVGKPSAPPQKAPHITTPGDLKRTPDNRVERPSTMPVQRRDDIKAAPVMKQPAPVVKTPAPVVKQPAPRVMDAKPAQPAKGNAGNDSKAKGEQAKSAAPVGPPVPPAPAGKQQDKDAKKGKW